MQETFEITTAAHWKAFSHPLRLGIISLLQKSEMTNEELAKALEVESGKLYFHTKQLLNAGLIVRSGTRQKGPITEKLYIAAAKNYYAPPPKKGGSEPPFADMVSSALELYRSSWDPKAEPSNNWHLGFRLLVDIPRTVATEVADQFKQILNKLKEANSDNPDYDPITVTVLMHSLPKLPAIDDKDENHK
jgi:DNA-binding transcriptional ArsR family regulator